METRAERDPAKGIEPASPAIQNNPGPAVMAASLSGSDAVVDLVMRDGSSCTKRFNLHWLQHNCSSHIDSTGQNLLPVHELERRSIPCDLWEDGGELHVCLNPIHCDFRSATWR